MIVETSDGRPRGYAAYTLDFWGPQFQIPELNVIDGEPLRAILPALLRRLKPIAEAEMRRRGRDSCVLYFKLGAQHPAFDAAPDLFHKVRDPYSWYMRVAEAPRFLNHIAPVLEQRLAQSALSGYSGEIKVTECVRGFKLNIERGKIRAEAWTPDDTAHAMFSPFIFLQLLFGRRSLSELRYMYPDCWAEDEAAVVFETLFPRRHSNVIPMG